MKFIAIYLSVLLLSLLTFENANAYDKSLLEYYGADHSEAEINIIGFIVVDQTGAPTKSQLDPLIRLQMRYMLGLMRSREQQAAALYPKWTFSILETKKIAAGSYSVKYHLKTKGVFATGTTEYTFTLPYNPKKIFKQAQGKCMESKAEESNFWYHWEPLLNDCPLKENIDYYNYTTDITPIINTIETYPEYDKLLNANKTINMTMFFGFEKYGLQKWTPDEGENKDEDWGIKGYNKQRQFLKSLGFTETIWTQQQIKTLYKAKDRFVPYITEFNLTGRTANIRIRLILADTGFNYNSLAFHTLLKDAFTKESVIVYNGHSGIGHNLDLGAIEKQRGFRFTFNPKYQILFLGSCVPYSYYTEMFFSKKKTASDPRGSLNLDILSYGKEAIFGNNEDQALTRALVKYALRGERQSYQRIIRSSPNYFFGVNGDENNPKMKFEN